MIDQSDVVVVPGMKFLVRVWICATEAGAIGDDQP
ncbi:Uncharacterised protein [Mycobacteroides abscessus subsp. abscessus]|nr:Uncharacterised protein [Mycobacteroides abscessus subsp. abscessus]